MSGGKIALVTGAKARLGQDIALGLARHGWSIAVHYHSDAAQAQQVVEDIRAMGVGAVPVQAELAESATCQSMMAEVNRQLGPVTALVNNASHFVWDDAACATAESFQAHMTVNTLAPLLLSQAMAAQLPASATGSIVNIIDQRVWKLTPAYLSYTLSKAALWTLTQTLAQSLAPRIRVNGVGPGPTLANIHQRPGVFEREAASVPLGAVVDPAAITAAVLYLMEAQAVTGQMIAVDGGQHLAWQTADALLEMPD